MQDVSNNDPLRDMIPASAFLAGMWKRRFDQTLADPKALADFQAETGHTGTLATNEDRRALATWFNENIWGAKDGKPFDVTPSVAEILATVPPDKTMYYMASRPWLDVDTEDDFPSRSLNMIAGLTKWASALLRATRYGHTIETVYDDVHRALIDPTVISTGDEFPRLSSRG